MNIQKNKMLTFHNDPAIKEKYLARLRAHYDADEIIQGKYWENGKGCAVGCTIHGDNHDAYETELGISKVFARLEGGLFKLMTNINAKKFPIQFLEAVPIGISDEIMHLDVFCKFMHWMLVDKDYGVIQYAKKKKTIQNVADLYQRMINRERLALEKWDWDNVHVSAAAATSAAAAAIAAYAAAAATYAAVAAADADAIADADAYAAADTYAAAVAAADDDANITRTIHAKRMADKLIELLKEVKC